MIFCTGAVDPSTVYDGPNENQDNVVNKPSYVIPAITQVDNNLLDNEIPIGHINTNDLPNIVYKKDLNEIGIAYAEAGITGKPGPDCVVVFYFIFLPSCLL